MMKKSASVAMSNRLKRQLIRYVVICLFLFVVNLYTSPCYWWAAWVAGGWGLNVLLPVLFHHCGCNEEPACDETK